MENKTTRSDDSATGTPLPPELAKSSKSLHLPQNQFPPVSGALDVFTPENAEVKKFTESYLAVLPSLRAFLFTIVRDPSAVEDCLQEACIVLWKKRNPDWTLEDFRKVAFTCARFKGLNWLKKNKPNLKTPLSPELTKQLSLKMAEQELRNKNNLTNRLEAMRNCLDRLSDTQRKIIQARYESDQADALANISTSLGRSMDAIYKQLERTRTALRKCIQQQLSS